MWTRGSTPWAAGQQYSGWIPSETRQSDFRSNIGYPTPSMTQSSHDEETREQADFESRRSSSLSFDHSFHGSNMFRDSLVSPTVKGQFLWPRGIEERGPVMRQTRLFPTAINQPRNGPKAGFPSDWEGDNVDGQVSESVSFSGSHHFNGLGLSGETDDSNHLNADSQIFIPSMVSGLSRMGISNQHGASIESPPTGGCGSEEMFSHERYCVDFNGSFQTSLSSAAEEIELSRHQTPVQSSANAPRRLFQNIGKETNASESPMFDSAKWASPGTLMGTNTSLFFPLSPGAEHRVPSPATVVPSTSTIMKMAGGASNFCRQVELFGGSGPSYKPDSEERFRATTGCASAGNPSPPQAIPSPMPPKPKVVQFPTLTVNDEILVDDVSGIDRKTCDALLLNTLVFMVRSFGGGPIEQGRIGNALSKEEAVRTYIKDKHGSLINFLLGEGSSHFTVTPGINGCYLVSLRKGLYP